MGPQLQGASGSPGLRPSITCPLMPPDGRDCGRLGTRRTTGRSSAWRASWSWARSRLFSRSAADRVACGRALMLRYIIRRVLYAIPILIGVCLVTFLLFYVVVPPAPACPPQSFLEESRPSRRSRTGCTQHGYDRPLAAQFTRSHAAPGVLPVRQLRRRTGSRSGERFGEVPDPRFDWQCRCSSLSSDGVYRWRCCFAYYRGTYLDLWGLIVSVIGLQLSRSWFTSSPASIASGKILRLFPLAGYGPGLDAWKFVVMPLIIGVISGIWGSRAVLPDGYAGRDQPGLRSDGPSQGRARAGGFSSRMS